MPNCFMIILFAILNIEPRAAKR